MDQTTMFWIAGGLIVILIIMGFNSIITAHNRARQAWASVLTYANQRLTLFPKLEEIAKTSMAQEIDLLRQITQVRTGKTFSTSTPMGQSIVDPVQEVLTRFFAVAENYPTLQSVSLYRELMENSRRIEENVSAAISAYNGNVEDFNSSIDTFPGVVFNIILGKERINEYSEAGAASTIDYRPNFD